MKTKTFIECCHEVAVKYKLGKTLVTGHKYSYFEEASEMYASQFYSDTKLDELENYVDEQINYYKTCIVEEEEDCGQGTESWATYHNSKNHYESMKQKIQSIKTNQPDKTK